MRKELAIFNELAEKLFQLEGEQPVAPPLKAADLPLLGLSLEAEGISDAALQGLLSRLIEHTPKTASKLFFNQLFGGRQPKATLGDLLSVLLNNSLYTYKIAGVHAGVEKMLIRALCRLAGYHGGDGAIASGGSLANFMALVMARDAAAPEASSSGVGPRMVGYASAEAHYSIRKNAAMVGIGAESIRLVETDTRGRMNPQRLSALIQRDMDEGRQPFFVNATAGTTVLGAFDQVKPIREICSRHGLWLHLDGAYGGAVIFSERYRHLIEGVELTDSFCVNAHKILGVPLTCSLLITAHKAQLRQSFFTEAPYLYQTDDDECDLGKTSLQCGRRNDALKLWTLWKSVGGKGLEAIVNHAFALADVARRYVQSHEGYTLHSFEDSVSVCFNYKDFPAKELCHRLYTTGTLMVSHGSFRGTDFIRLVTLNTALDAEDVIHFFKTLEAFCEPLQLPAARL